MQTTIALLRGINVGGRNRLPMKALTGILEAAGCSHIQTYIQSGNVVFDRGEQELTGLGECLTGAIEVAAAFRPYVLVMTAGDLAAAVHNNPFPEAAADPKTLHFFFLSETPTDPDLKALGAVKKSTERFRLIGKVFYLHAPEGIGRSKLAAQVERKLGVPLTARNWRTVEKLMGMVESLD